MGVPDFGAYNRAVRDKTGLDSLGTTADVVYHGSGGHNVAVETPDAQFIKELANHGARHSPTGFSWGYAGSGPAALARSLLIHALGDAASCPMCNGTHIIVWSLDAEEPRPWEASGGGAGEPCSACDDGFRRLPYQDFKFEIVARWPQDAEWRVSRTEVLAWLRKYAGREDGWSWLTKAARGR
jgi:hypothetical protein